LVGAEIRAGNEEIGCGTDFGDAFGYQAGFFDAFLSEEAIGVGGTLGIFAIYGDAMADDVKLHALWLLERVY
jgi:hypothetical protein